MREKTMLESEERAGDDFGNCGKVTHLHARVLHADVLEEAEQLPRPDMRRLLPEAGCETFFLEISRVSGSKLFKDDEKWNNSANTHPNHLFLTGNSTSRPGEGFGKGLGAPKHRKIETNMVLAPLGMTTLIVIWQCCCFFFVMLDLETLLFAARG